MAIRVAYVLFAYAALTFVGIAMDPGAVNAPLFAEGIKPKSVAVALLSPIWFGLSYHGPMVFSAMTIICLPLCVWGAVRWDKRGVMIAAAGTVIWIIGSLIVVTVLQRKVIPINTRTIFQLTWKAYGFAMVMALLAVIPGCNLLYSAHGGPAWLLLPLRFRSRSQSCIYYIAPLLNTNDLS
jgi:uncharacterized membrane protein